MEAPAPPPKPSSGPAFPTLEVLDRNKPRTFVKPTKRIHEGPDVEKFLTSKAYRDIGVFIMQLNRAMCPRKVITATAPGAGPGPGTRREMARTWTLDTIAESSLPAPVKALREMLRRIEGFIEEAPPKEGPRRFGNVSCRTWHAILAERADALMEEFIPREVLDFPCSGGESKVEGVKDEDENKAAGEGCADGGGEEKKDGSRDELRAYLLGSFGSSQRLDYGTGHELCFLAFLGCLWKLGMFRDEAQGGEIERNIILGLFEPYLKVVRRLILTYNLEPAGSHGVWGLDDHAFLPYVFGSAQLTRPITEEEPMPQEGSVRGAPKTGDVVKADVVERERERNLYFSAIGFINDVKKGPFWEHSPILYDVSGVQDGWGKINKGMIKMFNAEVLSKFPVVQHFNFGSLFSFDHDPEAAAPVQSIHMANQPPGPGAAGPSATGMPPPPPTLGVAPWAQAAGMPRPTGPGIPYSRVHPPGVGTQRPNVQRGPPRGDPRGGP